MSVTTLPALCYSVQFKQQGERTNVKFSTPFSKPIEITGYQISDANDEADVILKFHSDNKIGKNIIYVVGAIHMSQYDLETWIDNSREDMKGIKIQMISGRRLSK